MRVTIKYGPANCLTRDYPTGTPVKEVIFDRNVQSVLGYGNNVQVSIDNRHVQLDYQLGSDVELTLETVANRKASTIQISVRYGAANVLEKEVPSGTTVGDIKRNRDFMAALGAPANVKALIDGIEQTDASPLDDGDEVSLETVANVKAA